MWLVVSNIKHFRKHLIVRSGQCEIPDLGLSFNQMSLLSKLCKLTRFGRVQFWTCSVGAPTQCKVSGSTVIIVTTVSLSFERWGGEPGNGHVVIHHKARNLNLIYMHILMFVRSIFQFFWQYNFCLFELFLSFRIFCVVAIDTDKYTYNTENFWRCQCSQNHTSLALKCGSVNTSSNWWFQGRHV